MNQLTHEFITVGKDFAAEFAGEYFDEEFLEHNAGDLLQHWPSDLPLAPWDKESDVDDDKTFGSDEFVEKYVRKGNEIDKRWLRDLHKRDINGTALADDVDGSGDFDDPLLDYESSYDLSPPAPYQQDPAAVLAARNNPLPYHKNPGDLIANDLEERFFWLIPIFAAIATTLARVAAVAARVVPTLLRVAKDTVKVAAKRGANGFPKQAKGFAKIAKKDSKTWRNCLQKMGPP